MPDIQIEEITITAIIQGQKEGKFSALDLVFAYMDRIAGLDKSGPSLNAVLELNPDAPAIAAGLDTARDSGKPLGPLHGVPVLLKDNINTGDKMHTSAGSLALADSYAPSDAFLVQQLRAAGAVILGKANMTEWANFMTKGMPNGYSSRGGQVINPYGKGLDVGGSSSGSGAATAANLCAAAVGTETSGSILSPAINNSLVGIKPTVGLISRSGVIPISTSQDTAGPLARTVADAAVLLAAMRGVDPADPATASSAPHSDSSLAAGNHDSLSGVRIGVPRSGFWESMSEPEKKAAEFAIQAMADLGADVIDPAEIATAERLGESRVLIHEFKSGINSYLASLGPGARVRTLAEVLAFNKADRAKRLRYGQTTLRESQRFASGTLTEPEYIRSRLEDIRLCRTDGIDATMAEHRLDALFFPSYCGCAVCARAGYPSVAVPWGLVDSEKGRKPFGITLSGQAWSEPALIFYASALEHEHGGRETPVFA